MRRRPAAAAAACGEAMTRRQLVVCYSSPTTSEAPTISEAPTPSEACRRFQHPANAFIIFSSAWMLTFVYVYSTGHNKKINQGEVQAMSLSWRYENQDPTLAMLCILRPKPVASMLEYCRDMPVITRFIVPGAIPQKQNDGKVELQKIALLAEPAQELIRSALLFLSGLFKCGYCLSAIHDDSLMVETPTASVFLSQSGKEDLISIGSKLDVERTIACLGLKLQHYIFAQNGHSTEDVPEVLELFSLMANPGSYSMWYAIVNNSALVPLDNKREFYVRMYEQLHSIVKDSNRADFDHILEELEFPLNWHESVSRELNGVLFLLYTGGVYDATAVSKKEQAEQITKMFRNSGVHVLDRLGYFIGRSDVCLVHYVLAPMLYSSIQAALQKRGWLASTQVHTLLVYTRRFC